MVGRRALMAWISGIYFEEVVPSGNKWSPVVTSGKGSVRMDSSKMCNENRPAAASPKRQGQRQDGIQQNV